MQGTTRTRLCQSLTDYSESFLLMPLRALSAIKLQRSDHGHVAEVPRPDVTSAAGAGGERQGVREALNLVTPFCYPSSTPGHPIAPPLSGFTADGLSSSPQFWLPFRRLSGQRVSR